MTNSTPVWESNRTRCTRPGCNRYLNPKTAHDTCSALCRQLKQDWETANNLHETLGQSPLTDRYLTETRKLMTDVDEVQRMFHELRKQAESVGIEGRAWHALIRGVR